MNLTPTLTATLTAPFSGSLLVAMGVLTEAELRGPRFRRLYPDVYLPAGTEADLAVRAYAAGIWAGGEGVVAGWAAAELLKASCGPRDATVDVILPGPRGRTRAPVGIRPRRVLLDDDEVQLVGEVPVTLPARTAFDIARWAPTLTERVAGADAVAYAHKLTVDRIRAVWSRHRGAHGTNGLSQVLNLMNPLAESPMESRIRMALFLAGLPAPIVQCRAGDHRLDHGYPEVMLGVEYNGSHHLEPDQALRDLDREAALTRAGWTLLRYPARTVLGAPESIAAEVRSVLASSPAGRRLLAS
jgi:very-short-patch-repair endonuclease